MAQFDAILGDRGLHYGANQVLVKLVKRLEVTGADSIPRDGPLLIVANRPGLSDVLAIFATLDRADLRIVAAECRPLRTLRGVNRHFIYVPRERGRRLQVMHEILTHLRSAGAVLLLPAGNIEPDRAVSRDALTSLESWSASIGNRSAATGGDASSPDPRVVIRHGASHVRPAAFKRGAVRQGPRCPSRDRGGGRTHPNVDAATSSK